MEPSHESPLLRPENVHKQLVVIDFEYASANTPGIEFANHFVSQVFDSDWKSLTDLNRLNGAITIMIQSGRGHATPAAIRIQSSSISSLKRI